MATKKEAWDGVHKYYAGIATAVRLQKMGVKAKKHAEEVRVKTVDDTKEAQRLYAEYEASPERKALLKRLAEAKARVEALRKKD